MGIQGFDNRSSTAYSIGIHVVRHLSLKHNAFKIKQNRIKPETKTKHKLSVRLKLYINKIKLKTLKLAATSNDRRQRY